MDHLSLLPSPRRVTRTGGSWRLPPDRLILLQNDRPQALRFAAGRIQTALQRWADTCWEVTASRATPQALIGLTLRLDDDAAMTAAQGYTLAIRTDGITIEACDAAGLFYGACTLIQIVEQADPRAGLPCLEIADWPDFPARGVMLDISRNKVPTMATLYELVDLLAGWKINQLQLYTENTFAYRTYPEVWAAASPMTGQEILDLDAYCRERCVELVPNQNSFGHLERWLRHPRYMPLAEVCGEVQGPWGTFHGPYSLCPGDPGSLDLLRGMYDELLPHFASRLFNVGCDETWDLGQGRSRAVCRERGEAQVYLDFLQQIQVEVEARGRTMQFWGDILMRHPEQLPPWLRISIALEWGYEAGHPFGAHGACLAEAGIPFYVCPGTSSWTSIAGRTDNALGNLQSAAEHGLRCGAIGYLNTDWGDRGHWQVLPVSYLGFAVGAAYSWALSANRDLDVAHAVSWHAFRDATGSAGRAAYDMGNVYRAVGVEPENTSALFDFLAEPFAALRKDRTYAGVSAAGFERALAAIDAAAGHLAGAHLGTPDGRLVRQEFDLTLRMLRHASRRGLLYLEGDGVRAAGSRYVLDEDMQMIMAEFQRIWLARNRPGGLSDSLNRLDRTRREYAQS